MTPGFTYVIHFQIFIDGRYLAMQDSLLSGLHSIPAKSMDDFFDNWTVQVRKGVLELCLLSALDAGEHYGYALVKRLSAMPGLSVAEGSIYPLLSRMKSAGLVDSRLEESSSGPARKYYQLTDAGRGRLTLMRPYFSALVEAVRALQPDAVPPLNPILP